MRQASPVPSLAPVLLQQALAPRELAQLLHVKSLVGQATMQPEPSLHQAQGV